MEEPDVNEHDGIEGAGDGVPSDAWTIENLASYLKNSPMSLMAQNVDHSVFADPDCKLIFEQLFRNFCSSDHEEISFNYLPSFKRVRVNYPIGLQAVYAKVALHQTNICGSETNVYVAEQPLPPVGELEVPKSDKMFLISPPPSPPVGWESTYEEAPHPAPRFDLNGVDLSPKDEEVETTIRAKAETTTLDPMQLLSAFAHQYSKPGEVVEVLPSDEGNPSIKVTSVDGPSSPAYDSEGEQQLSLGAIPHTPCPPRNDDVDMDLCEGCSGPLNEGYCLACDSS